MRRPLGRLLVAAGLVVVVATWPVVTAAAHATLVSMAPEDGSLVTVPPTTVVLTFDQPIQDVGTAVNVTAPSGISAASGSPVVLNNTVTQQLVPLVDRGTYDVAYRVTSADGHPITQSLSFAYGSRSASGPAPSGPGQGPPARSPLLIGAAAGGLVLIVVAMYLIVRRPHPGVGEGADEQATWSTPHDSDA